MTNRLYYGDNLDVLRRKIESGSVDLCYIDPPFNSKRNYFQMYNNQGGEDRAQAQAFVDTWEWGDEAVEGLEYILHIDRLQGNVGTTQWTEQTVELIRGLEKVLGRGSLLAYLVHMTLRIVEIHRVLKPTGSFYLHCDPTASHYLKLVLDAVFCGHGGISKTRFLGSARVPIMMPAKGLVGMGVRMTSSFFIQKAKKGLGTFSLRVTRKATKNSIIRTYPKGVGTKRLTLQPLNPVATSATSGKASNHHRGVTGRILEQTWKSSTRKDDFNTPQNLECRASDIS